MRGTERVKKVPGNWLRLGGCWTLLFAWCAGQTFSSCLWCYCWMQWVHVWFCMCVCVRMRGCVRVCARVCFTPKRDLLLEYHSFHEWCMHMKLRVLSWEFCCGFDFRELVLNNVFTKWSCNSLLCEWVSSQSQPCGIIAGFVQMRKTQNVMEGML